MNEVYYERGASSSIYSHGMVGCREYSKEIRLQPPWRSHQEMPHGRRRRLEQVGVRAHPGVACLRSPSAWQLHVGPRLLPHGFEAQYLPVGGLFLVCLLRIYFTPSLVAHFDHIFHVFKIYVVQNTNCPIHVEMCQYK